MCICWKYGCIYALAAFLPVCSFSGDRGCGMLDVYVLKSVGERTLP